MEMRHLRYFVAVGETLHFGRAAARLGIAHPSLSQQLQKLEASLQTTLLRRTSRQVELTEAGRVFLEHARDILARADRAAVLARRNSLREADRVRIGFPYWIDVTPVLAAVRRLKERAEGFRFEIATMSVPQLAEALKSGAVDIALVRPPLDDPALETEDLKAEPFVVALPARHPLAARARLPLAALANEPFVLFPRNVVPRFYDLAVGLCRQAGFVPNVQHEVDSAYLILRLVAAGLGVSLVPSFAPKGPVPRGVVFRHLHPAQPVLHTAVAWRRDDGSAAVAAFVDAIRRSVRQPR